MRSVPVAHTPKCDPVSPHRHGFAHDIVTKGTPKGCSVRREVCSPRVMPVEHEEAMIEGARPAADDPEELGQEGRRPQGPREPEEPSYQERESHRRTHIPYRPWCRECVQGRGRDRPHKRIDRTSDGVPIISLDFSSLATKERRPAQQWPSETRCPSLFLRMSCLAKV